MHINFKKNVMSKFKLYIIACFLIGFNGLSQEKIPSNEKEVEILIKQYIKENQHSILIPDSYLENSELNLKNPNHLAIAKESIIENKLKGRFFKNFPEYLKLYNPSQNHEFGGGNCGFEGGATGYQFFMHEYQGGPTKEFVNCTMDVNQNIPVSLGPLNEMAASDVSLVSPGFDPTLLPLGHFLSRTLSGNRAIRINGDQDTDPEGRDDRKIITMRTTKLITSDKFIFNFASVMQNPNTPEPHLDDQPFFQVKIYDNQGNLYDEQCIISDADDCTFINTGVDTILYSDWSCFILNTPGLIGQNVTIDFIAADCGRGGHFGYVYIDNICDTVCTNSSFGNINLNELDPGCPEYPIEVCGSFTPPLVNTSQEGELDELRLYLDIYNGNPSINPTGIVPTISNNTFCFQINEGDIPNINNEYEIRVEGDFTINCVGTPYSTTIDAFSTNIGPDITFDTCCDIDCPDLYINKFTLDDLIYDPGDFINYKICVRNDDPFCEKSFTVTDPLDMSILDISEFSTTNPNDLQIDSSTGVVTINVLNLEPGEQRCYEFSVQIFENTMAFSVENCATINLDSCTTAPSSYTSCIESAINGCIPVSCPDLSLSKNATSLGGGEPTIFDPGDTINYQIKVTNNETEGCGADFVITDVIDTTILNWLSFDPPTNYPFNITTNSNGVIYFQVLDLEPGETFIFTFKIDILEFAYADEIENCVNINFFNCDTITSCTTNQITCDGDLLPINFGSNSRTIRRLNDIVLNSNGYSYLLFDTLNSTTSEFDNLGLNQDFTQGTYILKFSPEQCLVDFVQLSTQSQYYGRLEIDSNNNLYAQLLSAERLIKLDEDLDILWSIQANTPVDGSINLESRHSGTTISNTSRFAFSANSSLATLDDDFILDTQPSSTTGPLVALINTNNGSVMDYYLFELTSGNLSGIITANGLEVSNNKLFVTGYLNTTTGGNLQFNGNYGIPVGRHYFTAVFNIEVNTLVPSRIITPGIEYTNLEFNRDENYLYAANDQTIDVYNEDLFLLAPSSELDDATLNDLIYDPLTSTVLISTEARQDHKAYLTEFNSNLGAANWQKEDNFNNTNEGVYNTRIARLGEDIYTSGLYKDNVSLSNGLPASVDYDLFLDYIDGSPNLTSAFSENSIEEQLTYGLFPNPAQSSFRVFFLQKGMEKVQTAINVIIKDFIGNTVFSKRSLSLEADIHIFNSTPGLYFVEIESTNGEKEIHKLIIE